MRLVIALGGNALLRRGEPFDVGVQRKHVHTAALALAPLLAEHDVVVTHGNGPQVGMLALQNEALHAVATSPLDVLDAESEGMIGYLIEEELRNAAPDQQFATLLTQVIVDIDDPAFRKPTKPIGPQYPERTARRLARERGWTVGRDGTAWRRLVPSPEPRRIVEMQAIRLLLEAAVVVICVGGGGIPVVQDRSGALHGMEAVIDKDLAAALLASSLRADGLLLLTDVDAVYEQWGTTAARPIRAAPPSQLRRMSFEAGTMAPKVEAACRFVESGGRFAAIGRLDQAAGVLAGAAGSKVCGEVAPSAALPSVW